MSIYTINLEMMMDECASRLQRKRPDPFFTDVVLKRWANLAIIEMAKRTKLVNAVRFMHVSANVARYTCPSSWLYGQSRQVLYLRSGSLSGYQYELKKLDRRGMQTAMSNLQVDFLSASTYGKPASGTPMCYQLDGNVIELSPIPNAAAAGENRICFKYPGIPNQMSALSAAPEIPLEHRMIPVTYMEHLGQKRSNDIRATETLKQFYHECAEAEADTKWFNEEQPPSMHTEEYYDAY